jgi:hypothetical protein
MTKNKIDVWLNLIKQQFKSNKPSDKAVLDILHKVYSIGYDKGYSDGFEEGSDCADDFDEAEESPYVDYYSEEDSDIFDD